MQRVEAEARLVARLRDGCTRLAVLRQEGAAKIRLPTVAADPLEAVLVNTAGGLTGGDRVTWTVEAEAGAHVGVTTQACERIYRSDGADARVTTRIRVGRGATVAWLPQETILFDQAALSRSLEADIEDGGTLIALEALLFGRRAMGEAVTSGRMHDRWRVRCGGRLVHAEDMRFGPDIASQLAARASTGGAVALATVLMVAPAVEGMVDAARRAVADAGGVSCWQVGGTGKLLARIVAADGYALRPVLARLLTVLRGEAALPRIWST